MLHRVGGRSDCLPPRRGFVRKPLAFFIDYHAMTVGEVEMVMGHGCRPPAFRRLSHTCAVSSVLHPTEEKRPPHPLWKQDETGCIFASWLRSTPIRRTTTLNPSTDGTMRAALPAAVVIQIGRAACRGRV